MNRLPVTLIMLVLSVGFLQAQELPLDFESETFTFTDFGGNASMLGVDPINSDNGVAVSTKTAGAATWAGTTMGGEDGFISAIPFTETETSVSVMVYSPKAGIQVRLKAEDHNDNTLTAETEATVTVVNTWQKLFFDFSNVAEGTNPFNLSTNFDKLSIFFDFGAEGDDSVYYWDDVMFVPAPAGDDASLIDLQIEGTTIAGFLPTLLEYSVELAYGATEAPVVSAQSYNESATVVVNPTTEIPGNTTIVVTSEDETTELTYTVSFSAAAEPSTDATLSDLLVNGSSIANFESSTLDYVMTLPTTSEVPEVTGIVNNAGATVVVNNAAELPGTTSVVVTAQDGEIALTYTIAFSTSSHSLPIDFENGSYAFQDFDGGTATVIANPQSSGINTSTTVAQIVRNGGAIWAGSKLVLDSKIDFSVNNTFSMKVFSTRADVPVLFKLEGPDAAVEVSVNTTVANEWETLTWDFTGTASNTYDALVFMFDFGTVGDSSANSTFLFDDVELYDITGGLTQIDLPVDFESSTVYYELSDFGGNETVLGMDPVNASNTVAISTKTSGAATWAGTTIGTGKGFATVVPFTALQTKLSVKVYSPKAGIKVRLKGEDHNDVTLTAETEVTTTVANAWENLVFDFNNVVSGTNPFNLSTNFDMFSIFFNFGVEGSNEVYYWDDVVFGEGEPVSILAENAENIIVYSKQGELYINSSNAFIDGKVEVFDAMGRMVYSKTNISISEQITLDTKGLLIVRVYGLNNLQETKRILVR